MSFSYKIIKISNKEKKKKKILEKIENIQKKREEMR